MNRFAALMDSDEDDDEMTPNEEYEIINEEENAGTGMQAQECRHML